MARDDWHQNREWNAEIESAYRAKLSRTRSGRPNYLWVQAKFLRKNYPKVALGLIDEYFETGDKYNISIALCVRAEANLSLGNEAGAVAAYKQALDWEKENPLRISFARLDLPKLIVERRLSNEFDYAVDILNSRFKESDILFADNVYIWNGTHALIAQERGDVIKARKFAQTAIDAAMITESSFHYHPKAGLVENTSDSFGLRVKRIANPPKLNLWKSLFSKSEC